jgi:hypothetical protein
MRPIQQACGNAQTVTAPDNSASDATGKMDRSAARSILPSAIKSRRKGGDCSHLVAHICYAKAITRVTGSSLSTLDWTTYQEPTSSASFATFSATMN